MGHILGAMSGSITRQVVLELDIEQPMHALDAPMTAGAVGDALDVGGRGADVVMGVEAASIVVFGAGIELDEVLILGKRGCPG